MAIQGISCPVRLSGGWGGRAKGCGWRLPQRHRSYVKELMVGFQELCRAVERCVCVFVYVF